MLAMKELATPELTRAGVKATNKAVLRIRVEQRTNNSPLCLFGIGFFVLKEKKYGEIKKSRQNRKFV